MRVAVSSLLFLALTSAAAEPSQCRAQQWVIRLHDDAMSASGPLVTVASDGGFAVAAQRYAGGPASDYWVLKLTHSGDIQWQKTYGGSGHDAPYGFQQTTDGGYVATGLTNSFGASNHTWVLKTTSVGDVEWQRRYVGSNQAQAIDQ